MNLKNILKAASPRVRELNPDPGEKPKRKDPPAASRKMNASEEYIHAMLRQMHPTAHIIPQASRFFRLADGDSYTPDFVVIGNAMPIEVWEVKGGYRGPGWEQGVERYKRTASQFSDGKRYQFYLAEKVKGNWQVRKWANVQSLDLPFTATSLMIP